MSEINIQRETLAQALPEMRDWFHAHWEEIGNPSFELKPNYAFFEAVEANGGFRLFTIRSAGALAGYSTYFVAECPHYRVLKAESGIYWIHRDIRSQGYAKKLFEFAENALAADGVKLIHTRVKLATPKAGILLEHLGYKPIEQLYEKVLS